MERQKQDRGRKAKHRDAVGRRRGARESSDPRLIYGVHAVEAVLRNPKRAVIGLIATVNAARKLAPAIEARGIVPDIAEIRDLDRIVGADARHQGVLIETEPLVQPELADLDGAGLVLVLDQITDPQNVGAILRSAAAFGAAAIVTTERHSAPVSGALAKAASGALEHVGIVKVTNLAAALRMLGTQGFFRIGLDAEASDKLEDQSFPGPTALVLGAEDKGLRRLTAENCDLLCRLRTAGRLDSLNVSNAAAVALHTVLINR